MKTVEKRNQIVSESRKIRKPLMEKKRRARINDSLEALKQILLESRTALKESKGQRTAKLEKADILEMTVRYLQHLHGKLNEVQKKDGCVTIVPTKLSSGEVVYFLPRNLTGVHRSEGVGSNSENTAKARPPKADSVWRPW
ncbi:hypothetical protein NQ315_013076 [Exocentrus adspersus]|uniref:BHLH domain-containing protein n=1 Tax=Exocentrus adspersus TaxID=1586481 RepID=A0AAV8VW11_9CUCU|nr:hypothetical protein NQ315_013076 [Exocentrus adspersus]